MEVGSDGPTTARLAIVGEKPSYEEAAVGRPLVGPTGRHLRRLLTNIGYDVGYRGSMLPTPSKEVYLTNAVKTIDNLGNPSNSEIRAGQASLLRELSAMPNLNCIVALGNSSLISLSNFHYNDVGNRRGSIIKSVMGTKMVPTYHTSYLIKGNSEMEAVVQFDLARARDQSRFPGIRRPTRHYNVMPTFDEAIAWLEAAAEGEWLSFDLETKRCGPHMNWYITHFGFAATPEEGFCVPLTYQNRKPYWTLHQEAQVWRAIQRLLALDHKRYITQNGLGADCWWLYRHGIHTPHMARGFDTMYAHRYLAADLPHALHFLTSIYTEEEYYKDESGKHEEGEFGVGDSQYQIYNAKDAAITLEIAHSMMRDMRELGMYDYYMAEKQSQWDVLFEMRKRGFHIDQTKKQTLTTKLHSIVADNETKLKQELGWLPNTKSSGDMAKLFIRFDINPTLTTKTRKAKISEERLLYYAHQTPRAKPVLTSCLAITNQRTLLSNFLRLTTDPQNFYHASYDLSKAKTGRLASEGADEGHLLPPRKKAGPQLQNVPRSLRSMFIADNPQTDELTTFDFSQAEPHVVAWMAGDLFYINALLSGKDVHRIAGTVIFRGYDPSTGVLPPDDLIKSIPKFCERCLAEGELECAHSERYLAKRCKNGFAYRMGARRLITVLRAEDIFLTESEANRIRARIVTPVIQAWWKDVERELKTKRWLTNIYGTKKEFFGQIDDKTLGDALSWLCQSAVTHLTCRAMRLAHERFVHDGMYPRCRVVTQTHDSITFNNPRTERTYMHDVIRAITYLPALVRGRELNIPYEVVHGPSWGETEKCTCPN